MYVDVAIRISKRHNRHLGKFVVDTPAAASIDVYTPDEADLLTLVYVIRP